MRRRKLKNEKLGLGFGPSRDLAGYAPQEGFLNPIMKLMVSKL